MACLHTSRFYEAMVECRQILLERVERDIIEGKGHSFLANELFRIGLISGEELETIIELTSETPKQKAEKLVHWMEKKVYFYPRKYNDIIKIFRQKPHVFGDLVPTLERKLADKSGDIIFENYDATSQDSQDTLFSHQSAEESECYVKLKCKCRKCTIETYLEGENCSKKYTPRITLKHQKPTASKLANRRYMTYKKFKLVNKRRAADLNAHYQNLLSTTISDLENRYPLTDVTEDLGLLINPPSSSFSLYSSMYKSRAIHLRQVRSYRALKKFLGEELCCWFNIDVIRHLRKNLLFEGQTDEKVVAYEKYKLDYIKRSCVVYFMAIKKRPMYTKIVCEFASTDFRKINEKQIKYLKNEIDKFITIMEFECDIDETNGKLAFICSHQHNTSASGKHLNVEALDKEVLDKNEEEQSIPPLSVPSVMQHSAQIHNQSNWMFRLCCICFRPT